MSGTSMDGIDASILKSDGNREYSIKLDKYFEYEDEVRQKLINIRAKTLAVDDLKVHSDEIKSLEREITLFHANVVNEILKTSKIKIDLLGFHGQTIFHDPKKKITKQLGDGNLLSKLTKKLVIYDFRQNDLENGGQGAPLTPIYHKLLVEIFKEKGKIKLPIIILNIGGIANITSINENYEILSMDIGPGNCLIDAWMRKNSNKKFDEDGKLASIGKINEVIFEQAQDLYSNRINKEKLSFDTSDFDISFARGLSLEEGLATLTDFTSSIISKEISSSLLDYDVKIKNILICGGGRKNKTLIKKIKEKTSSNLNLIPIDNYKINGDFIESQAFAFLAIRSVLQLPISFPNTTGCIKPCSGGEYINN